MKEAPERRTLRVTTADRDLLQNEYDGWGFKNLFET